jgi:NodT family efflux transporter outer membrane factor (OMF) lipoprotein
MKKILLLMALTAMMCCCSVYKKYQRPNNVSISTSYRDMDEHNPDTATIAGMQWRDLFTDAYLQSLIKAGLEYNTDLRIAHLRVEQAEAVLQSSRLSYLPSANLAAQGTLSSFDGADPSRIYSLTATASWEIDIFGKLTNANRKDRAALESSKSYEQAVQTQLIATVANSYYTLLMLDSQLDINTKTVENWGKSIKTMQLLKRAGQLNEAAVLQAEANKLSVESSILSIRRSINETENSLAVLLGREAQRIERGVLSEQSFSDTFAIGVPLQLLANRPDVRQAEYNLARAFYATNVARTAFYPSITLGGSAGWTNSAGSMIVNPGQFLWTAVGSLVQPLFNKGVNQANLKIAKAQQEEAQLLFQQNILNAGKEVNDALVQWQTALGKIEIGNRQLETLQETVHKTELLMKHSSVNYLSVLTAQQSLLQAEQSQSQNYFDKIQGAIKLYHALGGGVK